MPKQYFSSRTHEPLTQAGIDAALNGHCDYRFEDINQDKSTGNFAGVITKGKRKFQEDGAFAETLLPADRARLMQLAEDEIQSLLTESIFDLNFEALGMDDVDEQGSTLIVALFIPEQNKVYCASVGDSHLLTVTVNQQGEAQCTPINRVHSILDADEFQRLFPKGRIVNGRIDGKLNMSRSIGDRCLIGAGLIADPDVYTHQYDLKDNPERFFVVCSDGVDPMGFQKIADVVRDYSGESNLEIAHQITQEALFAGTLDNVSTIVSRFNANTMREDDMYMLGVFDGHGGYPNGNRKVSQFLQDCFLMHFRAKLEYFCQEKMFKDANKLVTPRFAMDRCPLAGGDAVTALTERLVKVKV